MIIRSDQICGSNCQGKRVSKLMKEATTIDAMSVTASSSA